MSKKRGAQQQYDEEPEVGKKSKTEGEMPPIKKSVGRPPRRKKTGGKTSNGFNVMGKKNSGYFGKRGISSDNDNGTVNVKFYDEDHNAFTVKNVPRDDLLFKGETIFFQRSNVWYPGKIESFTTRSRVTVSDGKGRDEVDYKNVAKEIQVMIRENGKVGIATANDPNAQMAAVRFFDGKDGFTDPVSFHRTKFLTQGQPVCVSDWGCGTISEFTQDGQVYVSGGGNKFKWAYVESMLVEGDTVEFDGKTGTLSFKNGVYVGIVPIAFENYGQLQKVVRRQRRQRRQRRAMTSIPSSLETDGLVLPSGSASAVAITSFVGVAAYFVWRKMRQYSSW